MKMALDNGCVGVIFCVFLLRLCYSAMFHQIWVKMPAILVDEMEAYNKAV